MLMTARMLAGCMMAATAIVAVVVTSSYINGGKYLDRSNRHGSSSKGKEQHK